MDYFGERLRAERKKLGLSQAELGDVGNVAKNAQLNYESGARKPDAAYLAAVAERGVDVLYVLTGRRELERGGDLSLEETEVLSAFRSMDLVGKAGLLGMVRGMRTQKSAARVAVGGDVGQVVDGDAKFAAPVNITVGKKRK